MLMLTKTHAAIVAAKNAEILWHKQQLAQAKSATAFQADAARYYGKRVAELTARLAPFIAPRSRNAKGHFLPTKAPTDQVIEALEAL